MLPWHIINVKLSIFMISIQSVIDDLFKQLMIDIAIGMYLRFTDTILKNVTTAQEQIIHFF